MFCPTCGTESTGLNYCNRCGANLSTFVAPVELAPISLTKPILIIGVVIVLLTLGGLGGIMSGMVELVRQGGGAVSPAIPMFGLPTILTIDILLIRQLSKLINAALSPERRQMARPQTQSYGDPRLSPSTARLEPAASVTENTTRFFDQYVPAVPTHEPVPAKKTTDR